MNGIEKVVTDIGKGIAYPFTHAAKAIAILSTALSDEPALKTAVTNLVTAAAKVIADGTIDVAAKGANLTEDVATITDMVAFFKYFNSTFLPAVESVVKDIEVDINGAPATPAAQ